MTIPADFKVVIKLMAIDGDKAILQLGSYVDSQFFNNVEKDFEIKVNEYIELTCKPCFVAALEGLPFGPSQEIKEPE